MYPTYRDLREALETPKWWDCQGVPRYCDFSPDVAGEIYCEWVSLMTVVCQDCEAEFQCSNAISLTDAWLRDKDLKNVAEDMVPRVAHWGDAPWHDVDNTPKADGPQCAGTTMSTDFKDLRVWHRKGFDWVEVENPMQYMDALHVEPGGEVKE